MKDIKLRKNFKKIEIPISILHCLVTNKIIELKKRIELSTSLYENKINFNKLKNRCLLSGRARGLITNHKLSRIKLKQYQSFAMLSGMRKASW